MQDTYPHYSRPCGWNELLTPRHISTNALAGERRVRFAVIGAGYAGIAASRRLAELFPDESIALLESSTVGDGTAGRNSGFMIDLPYAKIQGCRDAADAERQKRLLQSGLAWLKGLVDQHHIDCGWNACGNYKSAMTAHGEAELKNLEAQLARLGVPFEPFSRARLQTTLGTTYYRYALWMPNCILVQPAALVRGLANALPSNVILAENTPVLSVRHGTPHMIATPQGQLSADVVVFTNNSFLSRFGYARSRQITMYTYAALTPELRQADADHMGTASDWGMVPAERMGATTRKVDGKRFMIRTGSSYERETDNGRIESLLKEAYRKRYPGLRTHDFEYVWGGAVSVTRNGAPFFGQIRQRVYGTSGCNGSGIIKMSLLGKLLAEQIAGKTSALLADCMEWAKPTWIPPEPLRRVVVSLAVQKQRRLAKDSDCLETAGRSQDGVAKADLS